MVYWLKRPFFDQFFICLVFAKTSVQGFYVSSRCTLETLKQTLRFDRKKATILSRQFFLVKILWLFFEIKDTNIWREFDGKFRTFIQFISSKFFGYLVKSKTPLFDENLTEISNFYTIYLVKILSLFTKIKVNIAIWRKDSNF